MSNTKLDSIHFYHRENKVNLRWIILQIIKRESIIKVFVVIITIFVDIFHFFTFISILIYFYDSYYGE